MSGAAALRRRVPLVFAVLAGYAGAWLAPSWSELTASSYPLAHSAGSIVVPLAQLIEATDKGSSSRAPLIAADLETGLDELVIALHRGFLAGGYDAPRRSTQDVASLVAAYRRVFPTYRGEDWSQHRMSLRLESLAAVAERSHGTEPGVVPLLAVAAPPSERLLRQAGPELRAALGERREALAALWSAMRGEAPTPEIELASRPADLVLRLDVDDLQGRLRLYGDGRVVVTGVGLDAPESVRRVAPPERERLVLPLVAGGILAFDTFEAWRAAGAPGCPGLSTARRGSGDLGVVPVKSGLARRRNAWLSVTLSLEGLEENRHGARMGPIERTASFVGHLLDSRCQPEDPAIRELQSGIAALKALVADIEDDGQTAVGDSAMPQPRAEPSAREAPIDVARAPALREIPRLAILFNGAGEQGVWITDGSRTGRITAERVGPGLFASGDGRWIVYRRALRSRLVLVDRETTSPPQPLGPADWPGYLALWSPRSDALLLAGEGQIYVGDEAGGALRMLASTGNGWPASWSVDGRLVYLEPSTVGGKGLSVVDLAGQVDQVEHPALEGAKDFVPSPDGRHLAYQAYELFGALTPGVFTLPLDPLTGLPRLDAAPTRVAPEHPSFSWAPDGRTLLYALNGSIHEVAPDGTGDRVLVDTSFGEYSNAQPQVSPDGRWLLFLKQSRWDAASGQDRGHIYVALRDGAEPVEVAYGERPRWIVGGLGRVEEATPPGPSQPPLAID